ncbi:response regulator [candidate division WOR-3 bacterium]|uniref:Response regulator n=1 Tax=candidate division WOR-3 bacterium TaxID=2052148 RepID=A0A9D5KBI3_UNCW3|nr:response regulator [candidate division WOR-3 bacterium]MBD3365705.1 response regulator [candidate division WOR-3 bacterium]
MKSIRTILCLEDGNGIVQSMADSLATYGYDVQLAVSTNDAIRLYKKNTYDLVIVDLKVPEIEDIKFLVEIRNINPEQKVIVTTVIPPQLPVWKVSRNRSQMIDIGMSSFLIRPFSPKKVFSDIVDLYHNPRFTSSANNQSEDWSRPQYSFYDELLFLYAVESRDLLPDIREKVDDSTDCRKSTVNEFEFFEILPSNAVESEVDF